MIYCIIDSSHKWCEYESDKICHLGTDKNAAVAAFEQYFRHYDTPSPDSGKWHHHAILYEIPDGWDYYGSIVGDSSSGWEKLLEADSDKINN